MLGPRRGAHWPFVAAAFKRFGLHLLLLGACGCFWWLRGASGGFGPASGRLWLLPAASVVVSGGFLLLLVAATLPVAPRCVSLLWMLVGGSGCFRWLLAASGCLWPLPASHGLYYSLSFSVVEIISNTERYIFEF